MENRIDDESEEIRMIFGKFLTNKNILLHGPAGTGKTYAINFLTKSLRLSRHENDDCFYIVAPTGGAAADIGGTTIHFSFSLKPINVDLTKYIEIIPEYDYFDEKARTGLELDYHRIIDRAVKASYFADNRLEYLFIDEISMVGATLLIILDAILRLKITGGRTKPMGGVKCVFSGDFYQLPPVKDEYCFMTKVWKSLNLEHVVMETCRRFEGDLEFFNLVLRLRKARLTPEDRKLLIDRKEAYLRGDYTNLEISPLRVYPLNRDADTINRQRLSEIPEQLFTFTAIDTKTIKRPGSKASNDYLDAAMEKQLDDIMPKELNIKVGAHLILIKNYNVREGLPNGRMCKVISINRLGEDENTISAKTDTRIDDYSITILTNEGATHEIRPMVVEQIHKKFICSRKQFPFLLSWAISCHRSQGKTLESAIVDVSTSFTDGQSYVALSRVTKSEGLFIVGLDFRRIKVNPKVSEMFD